VARRPRKTKKRRCGLRGSLGETFVAQVHARSSTDSVKWASSSVRGAIHAADEEAPGAVMQRCNRQVLATNLRKTREIRSKAAADMRPLFNHLLRLAVDSAKNGYCQRAGQELAHARKLATARYGGLGKALRKLRRKQPRR